MTNKGKGGRGGDGGGGEGEEGEEDCWAVLVIVISIIVNQDTIGKL
jgi:hypothetical protein